MSTLFSKIKTIHPSLTDADFSPEGTIALQNDSDGKGDYIKNWNHPSLSRPTDEQLADA
jgi:hypothetical protein|tara:strand:- start:141 stop:317 length:177 start_codon:yes stop_codon:yes gene_type:complete